MKQLFLLAFIINYSIYAQSYLPGKILFKDGKELNGYVENFDFSSRRRGLNSIEKNLGLARKRVKFKSTKKAKKEYIDVSKIKKIILFDEDMNPYELYVIKVNTFNIKLKPVDLHKYIIIPLIKDGPIQLFGIDYYTSYNGSRAQYSTTLNYIKNKNDSIAYVPTDLNRINPINLIFSLKNVVKRIFKAFEYAGHDCPEYVSFIKNEMRKIDDSHYIRELNKEGMALIKANNKKIRAIRKKIRKKLIDKEEGSRQILDLKRQNTLYYVLKYLKKYEEMCHKK